MRKRKVVFISLYAALRWSCNTSHYKSYPRKIDTAKLDGTFAEKISINDRALHWVDGVPNKSTYYGELVEWALLDTGVKYKRQVAKNVVNKAFTVDFVAKLDKVNSVGIEAVYSDHKYLSKERIKHFLEETIAISNSGELTHLVVITNAMVRDTDKNHFANFKLPINIIESTISPDGVLSRLGQTLRHIKSTAAA